MKLTKRRMEIVGLVCEGKSNKVIAYELGLTEDTVKQHLHHIFMITGVSNRTELAVRFCTELRRVA